MAQEVKPFDVAQKGYVKLQKNNPDSNIPTFNEFKNTVVETMADEDSKEARYAIWTQTTSKSPRESHLKVVGKMFDLNKGMLVDGDYILPGELPNCKCGWILAGDTKSYKSDNLKPSINHDDIASIAGTQFLVNENTIDSNGSLTNVGKQQFQMALKSGGGSLQDQADTATPLFIGTTEYFKFLGEDEDNNVVVSITYKDKDKQKHTENFTFSKSYYNITVTDNNFLIPYSDYKRIEDDFEENGDIILIFGGVTVND